MAAPSDNDTTKDRPLSEDALTAHTDSAPRGAPDSQPPDVPDGEDPEEFLIDLAIAEEALARYEATGIAGTRPFSEYLASRRESAK